MTFCWPCSNWGIPFGPGWSPWVQPFTQPPAMALLTAGSRVRTWWCVLSLPVDTLSKGCKLSELIGGRSGGVEKRPHGAHCTERAGCRWENHAWGSLGMASKHSHWILLMPWLSQWAKARKKIRVRETGQGWGREWGEGHTAACKWVSLGCPWEPRSIFLPQQAWVGRLTVSRAEETHRGFLRTWRKSEWRLSTSKSCVTGIYVKLSEFSGCHNVSINIIKYTVWH